MYHQKGKITGHSLSGERLCNFSYTLIEEDPVWLFKMNTALLCALSPASKVLVHLDQTYCSFVTTNMIAKKYIFHKMHPSWCSVGCRIVACVVPVSQVVQMFPSGTALGFHSMTSWLSVGTSFVTLSPSWYVVAEEVNAGILKSLKKKNIHANENGPIVWLLFRKVGDTPTSPTQVLCYTHEGCTFILVELTVDPVV